MPTGFRHVKDAARRVVQSTMSVPAHYYVPPHGGPPDAEAPEPELLNVRRTVRNVMTGDMKGTNFNYAERGEEATFLIFWKDEKPNPVRNAAVLLATGENYFIDHVDPPDGLTVRARVVAVREDQLKPYMEAPP